MSASAASISGKIRGQTDTKRGVVLIPQRAVRELQGGYQVGVVGEGNKVEIRAIVATDRRLTWREPKAGAIALVRYDAAVPSVEIAERVRVNQSTLIVPGVHVGLEGYLRIWLGGREDFLVEGLRRIGAELAAIGV